MRDGRPASLWAPWAGLFLGAAAWFAHHQGGSDLNLWDCRVGGSGYAVALGLGCAALAALGGLISWRGRGREQAPTADQSRRFASLVGVAGAGLFLLAIVFQTLASVLVPACFR